MKRSTFLKSTVAAAGIVGASRAVPDAEAAGGAGPEYFEIRKYTLKTPEKRPILEAYLKENAIDPLSKYADAGLHQAKVRFTISSTGEVLEASLSERSPFNAVNDILLQTITSMPRWIPACNNDGISASQDFEFIVTRDLCGFGSLMQ